MTAYRSYIGDMDDPNFEWEPSDDKYRIGNLPRRLLPTESFEQLGIGVLWLMKQIESGALTGRQIDWGAWAVAMTGAEILTFWDAEMKTSMSRATAKWEARRAELATLDAARMYLIVVAEEA